MSVYFFDDYQKLIKVVKEDKVLESMQEKELTNEKTELLNDTLSVSIIYDKELKESGFMGVLEKDDSLSLYKIINTSDPDGVLRFIGVGFAANELDGYVVDEIRPQGQAIRTVAERLIKGTEWRIGHVDSALKTVSGSFYCISVKEALKQLQPFGCEIVFKCSVNGDGITDKWIEIYKQMGVIGNERFTYGDKALTVVKEIDSSNVFTSLIGRGRGEEVGDGFGRRIEFDSIVWRKDSGKPVDKPKGERHIEIPELTKLYGIPTKNGKMRKREKVVVFEDIEEPDELIQATYDELIRTSRPLVQFKTDILGASAIGNTVTIHRYDRDYHYQTRVFKTKVNLVTGDVEASLGDNIVSNSNRQASQTSNAISVINDTKMDFYDSTEVSKWQSDIIRGAKGGSVIVMNPEDLGISDSREPFQTVWMNGDSIATSNHFLVANSEGIGFIDGEFNMGNFKTAWTIDGTFNANYIRAGLIKADIFESSFNGTGDTLKLVKGMLQIWNSSRKIMELTKKGLEFWRGNDPIGEIGTTGDNFSWIADVKASDRSLFVGLDGGDFIKIANDDNDGMYLPSKKYRDLSEWAAPLTLYCKKGIDFQDSTSGFSLRDGNLHVPRKLFVGGKEVTGGGQGGGGGWNGQYPPEVTSQADKFAWQLWIFLISKGYSPAAAAGILGNVQGEVGNSMNPDTEQVGGPAYGAVQWDGSAYPLVGPVTWNGREYVKTLMGAASIKDNYTTMTAQSKLIDWCMYNGQWIGAVQPTTVNGFKSESSPETAALAFELNFERPAAAHPERQGYARNWYNKFKDLKAPEVSGNFIPPISAPITVTSEWGYRTSPFPPYPTEFHNGMDFVNGNPNTPIYASMNGEVVVMGNYPDWYGLYVVIKHANGKYTGYAHNSSVRVAIGDIVTQGQQIANMGTTGPSTAEHCHFQIMSGPWPQTNDGFENPRPYIFG